MESGSNASKVSSWPVSTWHEARMGRDADGRSWLVEDYEKHNKSPLMMAIRGLYEALAPKLHGDTFCFFQMGSPGGSRSYFDSVGRTCGSQQPATTLQLKMSGVS